MVGTDHSPVAVGDEERFGIRCPCRFGVHQGTDLCPVDVTPYSNQNCVSLFTGRILGMFHNDCFLTIGRRDRNIARCPDRSRGLGVHRIITSFRLRPSGNRNEEIKKQCFGIHTGSVAQKRGAPGPAAISSPSGGRFGTNAASGMPRSNRRSFRCASRNVRMTALWDSQGRGLRRTSRMVDYSEVTVIQITVTSE